jgi:hypothetical protein
LLQALRFMLDFVGIARGLTTEVRYSAETSLSDARVPGIASFWRGGAQSLAELFQTVGDRQVGDEFHTLVTELAGQSQTKRPAGSSSPFILHPVCKIVYSKFAGKCVIRRAFHSAK